MLGVGAVGRGGYLRGCVLSTAIRLKVRAWRTVRPRELAIIGSVRRSATSARRMCHRLLRIALSKVRHTRVSRRLRLGFC